ncbi:hypothetical protein GOBAR_DD12477 [Gossypium barbadense]|nr:hypothetical protein GOBAR_DD12477 [Gossypium barbadense]
MDKGHVLFKDIVSGNGKGTSNSKLMLEEDDIDLLDNDVQMEFADGLPSTRFLDRVQALMQNSMVKSIMIKLLGRKIGGLNAMLNKLLVEMEHIATILNGLPSEFDPLMVVITASREPFSLERRMSVLIDVETRLRDPLRLPVGINTVQNNSQLVLIFKAT